MHRVFPSPKLADSSDRVIPSPGASPERRLSLGARTVSLLRLLLPAPQADALRSTIFPQMTFPAMPAETNIVDRSWIQHSEDSFTLNVWAPRDSKMGDNLPVMVSCGTC